MFSNDRNGSSLNNWSRGQASKIILELAPFFIMVGCVYLASFMIFGSLYARYHDNLNSEYVYNVVIGRFIASGFDPSVFDVFLGGATEWYHYARVLTPTSIIYAVLDPKAAYFFTEILFRFIAYITVMLVGSLYKIRLYQTTILALSYSMLLSFSTLGIGLHAAPLIFYYVMRERPPSTKSFFLVLFIGLNSSLALHALFLPIALFVAKPFLANPMSLRRFVSIMTPYALGSIIASSGLIYAQLFADPSHRDVWVFDSSTNINIYNEVFRGLVTNQHWYHAVHITHFRLSLGIMAALAMLVSFNKTLQIKGMYFILLVAAISLLEPYGPTLMNALPNAVSTIQIFRLGFFVPVISLLLVMTFLAAPVTENIKRAIVLATLAVFVSGAASSAGLLSSTLASKENKKYLKTLFKSGEFVELLKQENLQKIRIDRHNHNHFDGFFHSHNMKCISQSLPLNSGERLASFGVDPMVAVFHGLPVIDGLHNFYPLWYKDAFIPVIQAKLDASEAGRHRITTWGSRLHLFADKYAPHILPDFQKAYDLGARFIISDRLIVSPDLEAVEIGCEDTNTLVYQIKQPHQR